MFRSLGHFFATAALLMSVANTQCALACSLPANAIAPPRASAQISNLAHACCPKHEGTRQQKLPQQKKSCAALPQVMAELPVSETVQFQMSHQAVSFGGSFMGAPAVERYASPVSGSPPAKFKIASSAILRV